MQDIGARCAPDGQCVVTGTLCGQMDKQSQERMIRHIKGRMGAGRAAGARRTPARPVMPGACGGLARRSRPGA